MEEVSEAPDPAPQNSRDPEWDNIALRKYAWRYILAALYAPQFIPLLLFFVIGTEGFHAKQLLLLPILPLAFPAWLVFVFLDHQYPFAVVLWLFFMLATLLLLERMKKTDRRFWFDLLVVICLLAICVYAGTIDNVAHVKIHNTIRLVALYLTIPFHIYCLFALNRIRPAWFMAATGCTALVSFLSAFCAGWLDYLL